MSQYDENRDGSRDGKKENRPTVSELDNAAVALAAAPEIAEVSTGAAGPGSIAAGAIHTQCHSRHDREVPEVDLLSPLTIRGVTFRNRISDVARVHVLVARMALPLIFILFTLAAGQWEARHW